jgi:hypothetical protein
MSVANGNRTTDWPARSLVTISTGPWIWKLHNKRGNVKQNAGMTEHDPRTAAHCLLETTIISSSIHLQPATDLSPPYKQKSIKTKFLFLPPSIVGLDSSVGISIRYGLDAPRFESRWEKGLSANVQTGPGPLTPASYTIGTGYLPGVKRPRRGADHSPHIAPRLKKE